MKRSESMKKAESDEELDRNGDDLALIKAAMDSTAIVINGKPFTPENPIRSESWPTC